MSREGLRVAKEISSRLPAFSSQREARSQLLARRDERLTKFYALSSRATDFRADSTPESLKKMEAWYFSLVDADGFRVIGATREEFEDCMATYFCHVVAVTHSDAAWTVEESPFAPGHYQIGIRRGLCTWAGSLRDHYRAPANKNHTRIFREYQKYFGRD